TYEIAKRLITTPYISLANILAKKLLVKEFIQNKATAQAISGHVMAMLQNPEKLSALRAELLGIRKCWAKQERQSARLK
ncbi:MAG: lipid-A-disaccharide synthase, partial [Elusimicrobia bacterium]|nr:lipid-A-disaccharide synthase [Elusimicrobiota bacterium]